MLLIELQDFPLVDPLNGTRIGGRPLHRAPSALPEAVVPYVAHVTSQSKGRRPQRGPCRMRRRLYEEALNGAERGVAQSNAKLGALAEVVAAATPALPAAVAAPRLLHGRLLLLHGQLLPELHA